MTRTLTTPRAPSVGPARGAPSAARVALVVAIAHGVNDAYAAFLHPLLPRLMDRMGLSIALAATLAVAFSVAASILQPLLGYLADRHGRRRFLVAGTLASGVFVSAMGWAPTFGLLVLLLALGGLGSAAFHPPGASYAVRISEGGGSGMRYSVFSFGGSIGYAVGPLVAVAIVQWRGLEGLWIAMVPVLLFAPLLYANLPPSRSDRGAHLPPPPGVVLRHLAGPLGLAFGISAVMAWAQRAFLTMVPIIVAQGGGSEALGAAMLSTYLVGQAGGTLAGGWLADRMDRRRLLAGLCGLSLPAHLAAVALPAGAAGSLAASAVAGFLVMATLPAIVVTAQEVLPTGAAVGSGIVMGLAWATGSVGVLGTGVLADMVGAVPATLATMPVILLAVLLALHPALRGGRGVLRGARG